jgi:hypothetical protein
MLNSACPLHSGTLDLEVELCLFVIWSVDKGEFSAASTGVFNVGEESTAPTKWDAGWTISSGRLGKGETSCSCWELNHYCSATDIINASGYYS